MLVPEENLGVVILTNAEEDGAFDAILYHVVDHYFHLSVTDWIAGFKAVKVILEGGAIEAKELDVSDNGHKVSFGGDVTSTIENSEEEPPPLRDTAEGGR